MHNDFDFIEQELHTMMGEMGTSDSPCPSQNMISRYVMEIANGCSTNALAPEVQEAREHIFSCRNCYDLMVQVEAERNKEAMHRETKCVRENAKNPLILLNIVQDSAIPDYVRELAAEKVGDLRYRGAILPLRDIAGSNEDEFLCETCGMQATVIEDYWVNRLCTLADDIREKWQDVVAAVQIAITPPAAIAYAASDDNKEMEVLGSGIFNNEWEVKILRDGQNYWIELSSSLQKRLNYTAEYLLRPVEDESAPCYGKINMLFRNENKIVGRSRINTDSLPKHYDVLVI